MNFFKVAQGLDVQPLAQALANHPELWAQITARQTHSPAQSQTETIFVRGPQAFTLEDYFSVRAHDYPALEVLSPALPDLLKPLLMEMGVTELGKVMIVKLQPHGVVPDHVDLGGASVHHFLRFHLCVSAGKGSTITVDGETRHFAPGELWWFDIGRMHRAENASDEPRVHIIFDALTTKYPISPPDAPEVCAARQL